MTGDGTLIDKAVTKYRRDGMVPLLQEGPRYVGDRLLRRGTVELLSLTSVTSDELAERLTVAGEEGRLWQYGEESAVRITKPYTGRVHPTFEHLIGEQRSPCPYAFELPNARLVGPYAISQTATGETIFEELGNEMTAYGRVLDTREVLGTVETIRELLLGGEGATRDPEYGSVINMVPRHGQSLDHVNYGAWFLEDLPRLRALEHASAPDAQLLIRPDLPEWAMEALRIMGYSEEDWVIWRGGVSTVDQLVVPRVYLIHSFGSEFDPAGRHWVRDRLLAGVETDGTPELGPRLFVSRQGQHRRRVVNFDEVMSVLQEFGFEPIRPEEYSMERLIQIYHNAEFVIGPHGSGMADMIYADDATVVEFFPKNEVRPVFYITANEFGHEYEFIEGENPPGVSYKPTRNKDILVDADEVRDLVRQKIDPVGTE